LTVFYEIPEMAFGEIISFRSRLPDTYFIDYKVF